jgi:hypothetical protein
MVEGQYYYVWDDDYSGFMIGKCLGGVHKSESRGDSKAILISTFDNLKDFKNNTWCYKSHRRYYREATLDEINWLKLCISEGKFIEKPKQIIYELW